MSTPFGPGNGPVVYPEYPQSGQPSYPPLGPTADVPPAPAAKRSGSNTAVRRGCCDNNSFAANITASFVTLRIRCGQFSTVARSSPDTKASPTIMAGPVTESRA